MLRLSDSISKLPRAGPATIPKLKRLGIETVGDMLMHLPLRYEDLRSVTPIAELTEGTLATIRGRVELVRAKRSFRKRMMITELQIADESGKLQAIWFRQPHVAKTVAVGDELYLAGKPKQTLLGLQLVNPIFEKVKEEQIHTAAIVPFYELTEGLTHKQLRYLMSIALKAATVPDELPEEIKTSETFPSLAKALKQVHWPDDRQELDRAIRRLKFEELFWLQLGVAYAKRFYEQQHAPLIRFKEEEIKIFAAALPFRLTDDQRKGAWQIIKDLESEKPMNRLLEGDVGSGKTVVAGLVILNTVLNGFQTLMMAPTEILALQHFRELRLLLPGRSIGLLTAKHAARGDESAKKRHILEGLRDGTLDLVIGTHSLIQEDMSVKNLGLVVIDEQHRFGVEQRKRFTKLSLDGATPHLLSMTATPIPRSLALTLYGELDISLIREKPLGRKPIETRVIPEGERTATYQFIRSRVELREQAFVICPLIDESDTLETKSVMKEYERLQTEIFPDLEVRYLHGKLKADEKKKIIEDFKNCSFPLLVTTSVIEVGIDIPNATIMVIEGAERFGLAQLHQFRGRVGRSNAQSYCFLFSESHGGITRERLKLLALHQDGFTLAEKDLALRGEGELFGTRQSGMINFKVATIHDSELIEKSRQWVRTIIDADTDRSFYERYTHKLAGSEAVHWE